MHHFELVVLKFSIVALVIWFLMEPVFNLLPGIGIMGLSLVLTALTYMADLYMVRRLKNIFLVFIDMLFIVIVTWLAVMLADSSHSEAWMSIILAGTAIGLFEYGYHIYALKSLPSERW